MALTSFNYYGPLRGCRRQAAGQSPHKFDFDRSKPWWKTLLRRRPQFHVNEKTYVHTSLILAAITSSPTQKFFHPPCCKAK